MAKKKFEQTMNKVARYKEELKMGCTTEKGIVRPLTQEEVCFRKGFCDTVDNAVAIKSGSQAGLLDPLYENQMAGVASAFAHMRGERNYRKTQQEKKQYEKLNKKYGKKQNTSKPNNTKPKQK